MSEFNPEHGSDHMGDYHLDRASVDASESLDELFVEAVLLIEEALDEITPAPKTHEHQWVAEPYPSTVREVAGYTYVCSACGERGYGDPA